MDKPWLSGFNAADAETQAKALHEWHEGQLKPVEWPMSQDARDLFKLGD